ncbi:hypothetical protein C2E23DRAFT_904375 [Lenzites betulinus]|nr:hypothetical protein C2E23DRAFT_904375 [Lenzites betulinus]
MDTLPLETLQRIFAFACTDGGPTGVALSLTSKVIRAASRTARFHSISLVATPRRFRAFVALYERECDASLGDKPHIRHLYLTYPDSLPKGSLQERRSRSLSPSPGWWQRRREFVFSLSWRVRFPKRGEEWSDEDDEDVMDDSSDDPVDMSPREDRGGAPAPRAPAATVPLVIQHPHADLRTPPWEGQRVRTTRGLSLATQMACPPRAPKRRRGTRAAALVPAQPSKHSVVPRAVQSAATPFRVPTGEFP